MKRTFRFFFLALALIACQPQTSASVRIVDGQNVLSVQPQSQNAAAVIASAGLALGPADKLYYNGFEVPSGYSLPPNANGVLQIRRAVEVTLVGPKGQMKFQSAALTVGQAVAENGLTLFANDFLSPLPQTPLTAPLTVTYRPARNLTISLDGASQTIKSAALTVGQALTEAGLPLIGLDYSLPAESKPLPATGRIKIVRVSESFSLQQKPVPFKTQYQTSDELELDTKKVLQAGEPGLAVVRTRVRTEDGKQVSSQEESEAIVRPPVDEIMGTGTKVVLHTVPGSKPPLQYWRAVSMYATWYSPCHSGGSKCSYGTVSGLPLQHGVVAMVRANYDAMQGQRLWIPGYGSATIGDVGGGKPGTLWIDLGYGDDDPGPRLEGWVTVYFLAPVPQNILYVMQ